MGEAMIRLHKLTAGYPKHPVLRDVDAAIVRGEFVGLTGPNGAGKTTLFKVILGLLRPVAGTVEVLGMRLNGPRSVLAARRRIGYVPQGSESGRLPMTVFDAVLLGRCGRGDGRRYHPTRDDEQVVAAVLQRFGLAGQGRRDLNTLSGGLRQRVALARAVAREPEIILMDEPTTHLDPETQAALFALAGELNAEKGITIMIISHDHRLLRENCARILTLAGGSLLEEIWSG